jgi:predicted alpha/beta hydrolase family esterase
MARRPVLFGAVSESPLFLPHLHAVIHGPAEYICRGEDNEKNHLKLRAIMKKKQVLFLHSGGPQGPHEGSNDLVLSLRKALGANYQVSYPIMPDPENPAYESWKSVVSEAIAATDDGVVLVGHSLGGSVLLKYLSEERCTTHIGGLCIIAAPYWGVPEWQVDEYTLSCDFAVKLPRIPRIFLYHSRNDEVVPFRHMELYGEELRWATIRAYENQGHLFTSGLPELVRDIQTLTSCLYDRY